MLGVVGREIALWSSCVLFKLLVRMAQLTKLLRQRERESKEGKSVKKKTNKQKNQRKVERARERTISDEGIVTRQAYLHREFQ